MLTYNSMCLAKSTLTSQPKMEMPMIGASAMLHNTLNNIFHHAKLMKLFSVVIVSAK